MWVFIPRVPPRTLLLAIAVAAPAVLLGALGNLLVLGELAVLDVWPGPGSGSEAWQALEGLALHVSLLTVGLFLVVGFALFLVVRFAQDAVTALNLAACSLLVLLGVAVLSGWSLGGTEVSARIGLGVAFWGLSWVFLGLHLYAFLNPMAHRFWAWVTMGLGGLFAGVGLLVLVVGVWIPPDAMALLLLLVGASASFAVVMHRAQVRRSWGFSNARGSSSPQTHTKHLPLAGLYLVLVLGLMGASYQHHFDYRPQAGMGHFVLMGAAFLVGIPVFGGLMRRSSRRTFLLLVPLAVFVPIILQLVQHQHNVLWAIALSEGFMLGAVLFVLQYLAEVAARISRVMATAVALGAVATIGAGGSVVAQLSGLEAFTPDLLLSLQFAAFFTAMLVALGLPEVKAQLRKEEELEEYLEVAKRLSQQAR
jgi:hypothetical protein